MCSNHFCYGYFDIYIVKLCTFTTTKKIFNYWRGNKFYFNCKAGLLNLIISGELLIMQNQESVSYIKITCPEHRLFHYITIPCHSPTLVTWRRQVSQFNHGCINNSITEGAHTWKEYKAWLDTSFLSCLLPVLFLMRVFF